MAVVAPVPPLEIPTVESVRLMVPDDVIGEPETVRSELLTATLVTVPALAVVHDVFVPSVVRTLPELPVCVGKRLFRPPFAVVAPVPPLLVAIAVPDQVPAVIVPSVVTFVDPAHVLNAVFSTLLIESIVRAVDVLRDSGTPVPAVLRPMNCWVDKFAILARVTAPELMSSAMVPDAVIGDPLTDRSVDDTPTLVTVPTPDELTHEVLVPSVPRIFPAFPVWVGSSALSPAFAVVCPVPPLATGTVLSARLMVPEVVMGDPDTVRSLLETPTLVTVPAPEDEDHAGSPPLTASTWPAVPIGSLDKAELDEA